MNTPTIQQIQKRTERAWFDDGLWELAFGVVLFLIGILGLLDWVYHPDGLLGWWLPLLQMSVLIGGFYALNGILRRLKERITYPRAGFVAYRKPAGVEKSRRILRSVLIAAFVGGLVGMLASLSQTQAYLAVICAAVFALSALYIGNRFGLTRFIFVGVLILLAGGAISFLHIEKELDIAVFFCIIGLFWVASGGLTLLHFLRTTPLAAAADFTAEEQ